MIELFFGILYIKVLLSPKIECYFLRTFKIEYNHKSIQNPKSIDSEFKIFPMIISFSFVNENRFYP